MARFYPLTVIEVERLTRDAVALTLAPRDEDRETFKFIQGQYLTFRRDFDGEEVRRSYSVCAGRNEGRLRVGIKRVHDGQYSTYANTEVKVGDVLEAMPPAGNFHAPIDPAASRDYLGFAGGSGITPVLSIIRTVLAEEPGSTFTLVYGNQSSNAIMFREELEDLKNQHLGRLSILHIFDRETQEIDLFNGLVDRAKCEALFEHWVDVKRADLAFVCGPEPMMLAVAEALKAAGMDESAIKFELFASPHAGKPKRAAAAQAATEADACAATVTLDGISRDVKIAKRQQTVLEAALAEGLDAPYACRAGVCSTCRAMVLEGEVEMDANYALEDYEVRRGYVLTCQSYPVSDKLVVDYDQ